MSNLLRTKRPALNLNKKMFEALAEKRFSASIHPLSAAADPVQGYRRGQPFPACIELQLVYNSACTPPPPLSLQVVLSNRLCVKTKRHKVWYECHLSAFSGTFLHKQLLHKQKIILHPSVREQSSHE